MKIGLLECDHVQDELRNIAGDYREMFPALFLPYASEWEFVFYDVVQDVFPEKADDCDAYICTGSRFSVYDEIEWIVRLRAFVRELYERRIRYAGVCFGHQVLGAALGGEVRKAETGWNVGVHSFDILEGAPWMQPAAASLNLLMMCQDQVLTLPAGGKLLASSAGCRNAMFTVGETMLGIQAHPEFPKAYNEALMRLRVGRIGEKTVADGIASLELPVHDQLIARWIMRFLGGKEQRVT